MITVKILGSGCANCRKLEAVTLEVVQSLKVQVQVEHITDPKAIFTYPILSTPGLVINEKLVSAGRIPRKEEITAWIQAADN